MHHILCKKSILISKRNKYKSFIEIFYSDIRTSIFIDFLNSRQNTITVSIGIYTVRNYEFLFILS